MATEQGGTQSVLNMMTAAVVGRREPAKPNLTLVGSEAPASPATPAAAVTGSVFPYDNMAELAAQVVANVRAQLAAMITEMAHLEDGLRNIEITYGLVGNEMAPAVAPAAAKAAVQKAREEASDASFRASGQVPLSQQAGSRKAAAVEAVAEDDEESFGTMFARKQQEAQAAVFVNSGAETHPAVAVPAPAESRAQGTSWTCPKHGKAIVRKSPRGRTYLACPDCDQFE